MPLNPSSCPFRVCVLAVLPLSIALAEERRATQTDPQTGGAGRTNSQSAAIRPEADRPGYGQLHRDFGFPGAIRSWERGMYLNPRHRGRFDRHPYYSDLELYYHRGSYGLHDLSYPSVYGDSRVYRESYGPGYENYSLRLDHAYDVGVAPVEIQEQVARQAERPLTEYRDVMRAGDDAFLRGSYSEAARYFLLASQLNQGDPSSRLSAAHAQTAIGQYKAAAANVHRAVDLQSKLAYLMIDIRAAYGRSGDFAAHVDGLRRAALEADHPDLWFLLGYYYHNSDNAEGAAAALARAHQLRPDDRVVERFAQVAAGVSP